MTNPTHNYFLCIYFNSVHVSSNLMLIIRRTNCINTSGICHSVSVTISCACRKEWHIPDVVLIQLIFLMMSTRLFETCTKLKQIHWKELCVRLVIYQEATSCPSLLAHISTWPPRYRFASNLILETLRFVCHLNKNFVKIGQFMCITENFCVVDNSAKCFVARQQCIWKAILHYHARQ